MWPAQHSEEPRDEEPARALLAARRRVRHRLELSQPSTVLPVRRQRDDTKSLGLFPRQFSVTAPNSAWIEPTLVHNYFFKEPQSCPFASLGSAVTFWVPSAAVPLHDSTPGHALPWHLAPGFCASARLEFFWKRMDEMKVEETAEQEKSSCKLTASVQSAQRQNAFVTYFKHRIHCVPSAASSLQMPSNHLNWSKHYQHTYPSQQTGKTSQHRCSLTAHGAVFHVSFVSFALWWAPAPVSSDRTTLTLMPGLQPRFPNAAGGMNPIATQ